MAKFKLSILIAVLALFVVGIATALTTFSAITTSTTLSSAGIISSSANLGLYSRQRVHHSLELGKLGNFNCWGK